MPAASHSPPLGCLFLSLSLALPTLPSKSVSFSFLLYLSLPFMSLYVLPLSLHLSFLPCTSISVYFSALTCCLCLLLPILLLYSSFFPLVLISHSFSFYLCSFPCLPVSLFLPVCDTVLLTKTLLCAFLCQMSLVFTASVCVRDCVYLCLCMSVFVCVSV